MGLFNWFSNLFSSDSTDTDFGSSISSSEGDTVINPASGLPMVGGIGGLDVEGNPYGTDDDLLDDAHSMMNDDLFDDTTDSMMNDDLFDDTTDSMMDNDPFDDDMDDLFDDDW